MPRNLPIIKCDARPSMRPPLRAPKSALERWDKDIRAAAKAPENEVEVSILTEIGDEMWGGFSASKMQRSLASAEGAPVRITLNSPGGDAFEGIAIYNLLIAYSGKVTVNIIGMAASAASVIAMAGDRIEMQPATTMMIHSAWGLVIGNQQDMRDFAEVLDMLDRSVAGVYAARTGMSEDDALELMRKETWMTSKQAKEDGFCDVAHAPKKGSAKSSVQTHPAMHAAPGNRAMPVVSLNARNSPGASGIQLSSTKTGVQMPTIQERIEALENTRAATAARMQALSTAAAESGTTFDSAQQDEFDTLDTEIRSIDAQLTRDKRAAELALQSARPVNPALETKTPSQANRVGPPALLPQVPPLFVRQNVEKGIPFARYAMAMVRAQGNQHHALQIVQSNRRWMDQTPQIAQFLMAAVGAGTVSDNDELVYAQNLAGDFIELLRPATILGQLDGRLRRVPFNIRVGSATGGTSAHWVGEGRPIPVSRMTTGVLSLSRTKLAGLTSITEELALDSSPSAELLVRNDLRDAVVQLQDGSFVDPDRAAVSGISPASITNDVDAITPSGTDAAAVRQDVAALFNKLVAAGFTNFAGGVWIMTGPVAIALSMMTNALGQAEFPTVNPTGQGSTFMGFPAVVSASATSTGSPTENMLIFALPSEIMVADDGEVDIRVSTEAAIEMSDTPTNRSDNGTGAAMVSMFQTDSMAVRAVRFVNWTKRRAGAVQYIRGAAYAA